MSDVHKLRFLQRSRGLGFSVEECRQLLALYEDKERASSDVKSIARTKLKEIERKITELRELQHTLQHLVAHCHGDQRPDCPILERANHRCGFTVDRVRLVGGQRLGACELAINDDIDFTRDRIGLGVLHDLEHEGVRNFSKPLETRMDRVDIIRIAGAEEYNMADHGLHPPSTSIGVLSQAASMTGILPVRHTVCPDGCEHAASCPWHFHQGWGKGSGAQPAQAT
eukprot:gene3377-4230_t